ncbi:uncharacterized protein [Antennarius striatus]|uniref:uncharacterized protein n=1 Tax=Antennarius striatus TaxID=241820 RepID=UPI0035B386BD
MSTRGSETNRNQSGHDDHHVPSDVSLHPDPFLFLSLVFQHSQIQCKSYSCQSLKDQVLELKQENRSLKDQLEQVQLNFRTEIANCELECQVEVFKIKEEHMKNQISQLCRKVRTLNAYNESLKQDLSDMRKQYASLQEDCEPHLKTRSLMDHSLWWQQDPPDQRGSEKQHQSYLTRLRSLLQRKIRSRRLSLNEILASRDFQLRSGPQLQTTRTSNRADGSTPTRIPDVQSLQPMYSFSSSLSDSGEEEEVPKKGQCRGHQRGPPHQSVLRQMTRTPVPKCFSTIELKPGHQANGRNTGPHPGLRPRQSIQVSEKSPPSSGLPPKKTQAASGPKNKAAKPSCQAKKSTPTRVSTVQSLQPMYSFSSSESNSEEEQETVKKGQSPGHQRGRPPQPTIKTGQGEFLHDLSVSSSESESAPKQKSSCPAGPLPAGPRQGRQADAPQAMTSTNAESPESSPWDSPSSDEEVQDLRDKKVVKTNLGKERDIGESSRTRQQNAGIPATTPVPVLGSTTRSDSGEESVDLDELYKDLFAASRPIQDRGSTQKNPAWDSSHPGTSSKADVPKTGSILKKGPRNTPGAAKTPKRVQFALDCQK